MNILQTPWYVNNEEIYRDCHIPYAQVERTSCSTVSIEAEETSQPFSLQSVAQYKYCLLTEKMFWI